jgi:hypothetical protein
MFGDYKPQGQESILPKITIYNEMLERYSTTKGPSFLDNARKYEDEILNFARDLKTKDPKADRFSHVKITKDGIVYTKLGGKPL